MKTRRATRGAGAVLVALGLAFPTPIAHAQPAPAPPPIEPPLTEPPPTEPPPTEPKLPDDAAPDDATSDDDAPDDATSDDAAPDDATPAPEEAAPPEPTDSGIGSMTIDIHGFVSQGGFISTANDYIGKSSRGSLAFFEAALNVSTAVTDRLRAGVQLFARRVGDFDDPVHIDWAFLDYAGRPWLGLRAGIIKMPLGLYNEYVDVDAARLPILLPQSVYPLRNRDALISHTGLSAYGTRAIGAAGDLEYQAWIGTLSVPHNALDLTGATLDTVDAKYVAGAQVFWLPPVEGLRIGGTFLRASIDFNLTLSPEVVAALIAAGLVPADYDGALVVSQRPTTFSIGSVEYLRGAWLFAAEYGRTQTHQQTSLPQVLPATDTDEERFYAMATYRASARVELGGYYAVTHHDVDDRRGRDPAKFPKPFHAFQRDLAATLRYDANERWLWKLEAHVIDGTAELPSVQRANSERYWGLALFKTTVTF